MSGIHHPVDCRIICQICNDWLTYSSLCVRSFIVTPDWLLHQINTIINEERATPSPAPFWFELTNAAACHNIQVLQMYDNDIDACIRAHPNSIISYGSEYRSTSSLHPLLMHHPRWPKFRSMLTAGSNWPLEAVEDEVRRSKNIELIEHGNHKSAVTYVDELTSIIAKEVIQGFQLPIPIVKINNLPKSEVAPVGIAKQWQVSSNGTRSAKFRLTHDQSFNASIGRSVNDRVREEELDEIFYRNCLSRTIHYIAALRIRHPQTAILCAKDDFKSAYHRTTLHGDTAAKCIITNDQLAFIGL